MPSLVSAEEEPLISNTILIGISLYSYHNVSAIAPVTSVSFISPSPYHQCLLTLQLSLFFVNVWNEKTQQLKVLMQI